MDNYGAMDLSYDSCNATGDASSSFCNTCTCVDDLAFIDALLAMLQVHAPSPPTA